MTFFVGENGSRKSTLLEAIAVAAGLPTAWEAPPRRVPARRGWRDRPPLGSGTNRIASCDQTEPRVDVAAGEIVIRKSLFGATMAGPTLRAGSEIMIGAPRSVHPDFVRALGQAVAGIPQVLEAHLPVCFIKGESESALPVLVVVLASEKDAQAVMERLGRTLERVVPRGAAFDVWPLTAGHELLAPVRKAGCRLGNGDLERPHATRRKWWQFWQ